MAMTGSSPEDDDPLGHPTPDPGPSAGTPDDDAPVPRQVSAAWEQAEARLYAGIAAHRPDLYESVILLARATVDALRQRGPSTRALLQAAGLGGQLVVQAAGSVPEGVDPQLVAEAALAMRHREVRAEQIRLRRLQLVDQARDDGRAWVVLEESGHAAGDPFSPYRRLEVDVTTGRAVLVTTTPDDRFTMVQHGVRLARLDLISGALEDVSEDHTPALLLDDSTTREQEVTRLKQSL